MIKTTYESTEEGICLRKNRALNPFRWLLDGLPLKGKVVIALLLFLIIAMGVAIAAFESYVS